MAILDYTTHPAALPKVCPCGNEHFRGGRLCAECAATDEGERSRIIAAYLALESGVDVARKHLGPELLEKLGKKLIRGQG